jgi:hypothetical protein
LPSHVDSLPIDPSHHHSISFSKLNDGRCRASSDR